MNRPAQASEVESVAIAPNASHGFARALFQELARAGLREVCVSPGSRSAPLALAAEAEPGLAVSVHLDERSAGFFALGLAKAGRRPVALICTSGTAVANYLPAIVEAHHARVPLLVLSADRPPELRGIGAGQTIDQQHLFARHVRFFAEAPVPAASPALLRQLRALAVRAIAVAQASPPGPVHLNLPFREPLAPVVDAAWPGAELPRDSLAARGRAQAAYTRVSTASAPPPAEDVARIAALVRAEPYGVIVCGPQDPRPETLQALAMLVRASGWPLVAEPASQLRRGEAAQLAAPIAHADLVLADPGFAARHAPRCVLGFGAAPTSKAFRFWLERHVPPQVVQVDRDLGPEWTDPSHLVSDRVAADPCVFARALADALGEEPVAATKPWREAFTAADRRGAHAIEHVLAEAPLCEPQAVRALGAALPPGALLWLASSLPIRDADAYLPVAAAPLRVLASRGANGIDGTLSSALGAAAAGEEAPAVLLTGDLAFLHDAGGLASAARLGLRVAVVVLDNGGGGIFDRLPVAQAAPREAYERLFRTPHGLDLVAVARAHGARAERVESAAALADALAGALAPDAPGGATVLHVPIDPHASLATRQRIAAALARELVPEPA